MRNNLKDKIIIGIIGLGYVGLPLSLAFGKYFRVLCYDQNKKRIDELNKNFDRNNQILKKKFSNNNLIFLKDYRLLKECNIFIVTVPTPIFKNKKPNLSYLINACKKISHILKKNDTVIFESTVFPGAVNEILAPLIQRLSKLIYNKDFFCGYSPERINPGDRKHDLTKIKKITSGSNKKTLDLVDSLYKKIIIAGTHKVSNIRVAEAAKVIENTQRDLNIALVNELSKIFNLLNLNTKEVLEAAATKWNFIKFNPGLVGGHCIGVDPYYLTHKAKSVGYEPKVILSGRHINDSMGFYVANNLQKSLKNKGISNKKINILIMGYTFKENCSDIRNTRVIDIISKLLKKNMKIEIYDPYVIREDIKDIQKYKFVNILKKRNYDAVIIAVAHNIFKKIPIKKIKSLCKKNHLIYDLKSIYPKERVDISL